MRNMAFDTQEKVFKLVAKMKKQILNGQLVAAYAVQVHNESLLFVHAGFREAYLSHLEDKAVDTTTQGLANHLNSLLVSSTRRCKKADQACAYADEAFEAGPERGGRNIGGPMWTDFGVLKKEAMTSGAPLPEMIQGERAFR